MDTVECHPAMPFPEGGGLMPFSMNSAIPTSFVYYNDPDDVDEDYYAYQGHDDYGYDYGYDYDYDYYSDY